MPANFNPSNPNILGMEWLPSSVRILALDSPKKPLVVRFKPAGGGTVIAAHSYLKNVIDQASSLAYCVEIIDSLTPSVTVNTYRPSVDDTVPASALNVTAARAQNGSTVNLWSSVDETTLDTSDYVTLNTTSVPWATAFRTTIAAGNMSGKRISAVRVKCIAQSTAASAARRGSYITCGLYDGTNLVLYPGAEVFLGATSPSPRATLAFAWDVNPSTGLPWESAEVELLKNTSGTWSMYFQHRPLNGGFARIYQAWLEVDTVTDNRKGYKYSSSSVAQGWNRFALTSATALASDSYYYLVSWCPRPTATRYATVPILADPDCLLASSASTSNALEHRQVYSIAALNGSGVLTGATSSVATVEIAPFLLETSTSIQTVSQPYVAISSASVNSAGPSGFGSEITSSASQTYGWATFVAGWENPAVLPDGPLTVTFVEGAGSAAGTVRATAVHKAPKANTAQQKSKLARVLTQFFAPYLTGGFTQYSLRFASTATPGKGWKLAILDTGTDTVTGTTSASTEAVGLGGQTDAYFTANVRATRYDMPLNVVSTSNPPGSFAASSSSAL